MKALWFAGFALIAVAASAGAQAEKKPARGDASPELRAPKGMCRIWLKDVPAAQQPAPTDCAAAVKNCPPTGKVIFGDTEETRNKPKAEPQDSSATTRSTTMAKSLTGKPPVVRKRPPE